jgi:hypothetical protein
MQGTTLDQSNIGSVNFPDGVMAGDIGLFQGAPFN